MGFKETEIGLIPEEWELSDIEKSCEIVMGQSPAGKTYNEKGIGKPFLQGKAEFGYIYPTHKKYTSNPLKIGAENTVLLSVRAPVGDVNLAQIEYCIGRGLSSLSLKQGDNKFLFYLLQFIKPSIAREGTGSTFKAITKPKLLSIKIPLPPLEEQKKITHVLSTVQDAREKTETVIQAVRELKKSLMKYLFTYGPVPVEEADKVKLKETAIGMIPEDWEVKNFQECYVLMQYGTSKRCEKFIDGVPVLRIPNILSSKIDFNDLKYTILPASEIEKLKLDIGDLLFVRTNGAKKNAGRCAMFKGIPKKFIYASYLIRVRVNTNIIIPDFIQFYTSTIMGRHYLQSHAIKTADGKYNINKAILNAMPIPVPNRKIQERIITNIYLIDQKLKTEQSKKQALDELFKSLLNNLMTGKIRVNNLNFD